MKHLKKLQPVFLIFTCIFVLICIVQIGSLRKQIDQMERNADQRIADMNMRMSQFLFQAEETMTAQAGLLSESHWNLKDIDTDTKRVNICCVVTPKEYQPERTRAEIICNGKPYEMELKEGSYQSEIQVSLLEDSCVSQVLFKDEDTVRTEMLNWEISPWHDVLMEVYASCNGTQETTKAKKTVKWEWKNSELVVQAENRAGIAVAEEICLVEYMDGKEINRTTLPKNGKPNGMQSEYWSGGSAAGLQQIIYPFQKTLEVPFGSTLELYAEVTDSNGFRYRAMFAGISVDRKGNVSDCENSQNAEAEVYDSNGKRLVQQ